MIFNYIKFRGLINFKEEEMENFKEEDLQISP
jgi:hypothetical protein